MKIATKTLASILLIAMLSLSAVNLAGAVSDSSISRSNERKLERIYKRHDRKLELRASVLGMSVDQLKEQLKVKSFDTILKHHGFKNKEAFNTALTGKLKEELKKRGWSDERIDTLMQKRLERISDKAAA
ncbi:hypothetical protein EYC58_05580 [Candidatus Saccharibacteria bacterium]|nr:MAG: hypothetical protein EYC58_05580 [Candidatus Saccharibacteria bacterium]